jgi:hypothetical protein
MITYSAPLLCGYRPRPAGEPSRLAPKPNQAAEAAKQIYFVEELDKIDRWSDDLKNGLELEIEALNREIREVDRQSRLQPSLKDKLVFQNRKPPWKINAIRNDMSFPRPRTRLTATGGF